MIKSVPFKVNKKFLFITILILFLSLNWVSTVSAETKQTDSYLALEAFSNSIADIAEKNGPAVVNIDTVRMVETQNPFLNDPTFGHFFWRPI